LPLLVGEFVDMVNDGGVMSIVCVHALQRMDDEVFVSPAPCEAARR
jgi:hypothetical protein